MLQIRGRILPVTLAAVVLVGGANLAAYASSGHSLLLGLPNSASHTTSVTNTGKGAALSLHSSKKSPPLAVNSTKTVKHLSADTVDGMHAKSLTTNVITYTVPGGTALPFTMALNGVPKGSYLALVTVIMHAGPNTSVCYLDNGATPYQLIGYGVNTSFGYSAVNASGLITVRAGQPFALSCNSAVSVDAGTSSFSRVTLTPVGKISSMAGTLTKSAPSRSGAGGR